jgi:peroxiredoxin
MPLREKLDAYRAQFEARTPPEMLAIIRRATEDLIASAQADRALRAGQPAPPFALPDSEGVIVSSPKLLVTGPLIVTFFPGSWCAYSNLELQGLQALLSAVRKCGAALVAISPQPAKFSQRMRMTNGLTFPILVDVGSDVARAFGISWTMPPELQGVYRQLGIDLGPANRDGEWVGPIPACYVIGNDGVVVYSEINPDGSKRAEPSDLLSVLEACSRRLS